MSINQKPLPTRGYNGQDILHTMRTMRNHDADWEDGKVWCLVYNAGEELSGFLKEAYTTYFSENALNPSAFPSLKRMEAEAVSMTTHLLGGGPNTVGNMTSGGTESILMAVKTAREWAKVHKPRVKNPKMILPSSAHPAFEKGAHYFGLEPVHVPVRADFTADPKAIRKAITRDTVMLVGSAPSYPQGVVDPIEEIAAIAKQKGLLCHVDACVGGMMLPFVRALGYDVPPFDFSVDGVTSMSTDLHKYGYAAKGASVIMYSSPELRKLQYFAYTDWSGGIYASPTMSGTRPGGAIAAAWAIMHRLGFEGYLEIAKQVMDVVDTMRHGINAIDGVEILGNPTMSVMSIGSKTHDIYKIGDEMTVRGWHLDRQQFPESLHLTISRSHLESAGQFVEDLREAVALVPPKTGKEIFRERAQKIALKAAVTVLPEVVVSKTTEIVSQALDLVGDGGDLPERSAAMYGMIATLPNRGDIQAFVIDALDKMTRYDPERVIEILESPDQETTSPSPSTHEDAEEE